MTPLVVDFEQKFENIHTLVKSIESCPLEE